MLSKLASNVRLDLRPVLALLAFLMASTWGSEFHGVRIRAVVGMAVSVTGTGLEAALEGGLCCVYGLFGGTLWGWSSAKGVLLAYILWIGKTARLETVSRYLQLGSWRLFC